MKKILGLVSVISILFCGAVFSQQDSYSLRVEKIVQEANTLAVSLRNGALDFNNYDKWYKNFKNLSEGFEKEYMQDYKQKESFIAMREGLNELSAAWNAFKQVDYAQKQYQEYITTDDVAYAHQWKKTISDSQKKATESINQALEIFKQASDALSGGN